MSRRLSYPVPMYMYIHVCVDSRQSVMWVWFKSSIFGQNIKLQSVLTDFKGQIDYKLSLLHVLCLRKERD